jgi:hypothetical protein
LRAFLIGFLFAGSLSSPAVHKLAQIRLADIHVLEISPENIAS